MMEVEVRKACISGDVNRLRELLKSDTINLNEVNKYGWTIFHHSCDIGEIDVVIELLKDKRMNVNTLDKFGRTPFYLACLNGNLDLIKILLTNRRVNINGTRNGGTPLMIACYSRNIQIVQYMLCLRGDISVVDKYQGLSALDIARAKNDPALVKLLESYEKHPQRTIYELQKELGYFDTSAELYAMVIYVSDNYLKIKNRTDHKIAQFFYILQKLPIDLQQVVCSRYSGKTKCVIPTSLIQFALYDISFHFQ